MIPAKKMEIEQLYKLFKTTSGVCIDTRQLKKNQIFFALKGENSNGNLYARQALENGAAYAVIDEKTEGDEDERLIGVEDALAALQELAALHRKTFTFPVFGLTGSNGKTTTKELIASVISKKYKTAFTQGNFNNHIGVPLTLLSIDPENCEFAIIEMGANHPGEIALLSKIAQPTHGLITNVGKAHLEGFGSLNGVKKGKGELLDYLSKKKGVVFVNAQNEDLMEMVAKRRAFGEIVFYQSESEGSKPVLVKELPFIAYVSAEGDRVETHLSGKYNFDNITAALSVGKYFDVMEEDCNSAIASFIPENNRSQVIEKGTNTVFLDAYNANPSSMTAAIRSFAALDVPRKMVILGDMFELGDATESEHALLGQLIASCGFDTVILAGNFMKYALEALPKAYYFPDKFSLHNWIMDNPVTDTTVLVKGSRGMQLESVVQFL